MIKKTSLNDIATVLNVSETLVSFVLNGHGDKKKIGKETQQKVLDTARKLNYQPNLLARGLRTGKTHIIGLIVTDISNIFYAKIAREIEKNALLHNYTVIFCSSDENPETEIKLIKMLENKQVDGMIISTCQKNANVFRELRATKMPFVLIDRKIPRFQSNFVGSDNLTGAYQATHQLIEDGFKKIALLKITPTHISTMIEREAGFRSAMKDHKLRIPSQLVANIRHDHIEDDVKKALKLWCTESKSIDAIFSLNNSITTSCLKVLNEDYNGRAKQISIFSFDDIELFNLSQIPVSSIRQPIEDIGRESVMTLINNINQLDKEYHQLVLPIEMKQRNKSKINYYKSKSNV